MDQESMVTRELYGGAMEIEIPRRFADISDFRPVPDHQEVFGDGNADESFVIEVIEYKTDVANDKSSRWFFQDLAEASGATKATVTHEESVPGSEMPHLDAGIVKNLCVGEHVVAKFKDSADKSNSVMVLLANIRLANVETDLLLTMNCPTYINPKSSAVTDGDRPPTTSPTELSLQLFKHALKTFKIKDWGLFGVQA